MHGEKVNNCRGVTPETLLQQPPHATFPAYCIFIRLGGLSTFSSRSRKRYAVYRFKPPVNVSYRKL